MKNLRSLSLAFIFVLICSLVFGQEVPLSPKAAILQKVSIDKVITFVFLMFLSVMGIIVHWLVDLKKAQAQNVNFTLSHYMASTWVSSAISFFICLTAVFIRHELANIPTFSAWEGGFFALLGYGGDSVLPLIFGFAKSKGFDIEGKKNEPEKKD